MAQVRETQSAETVSDPEPNSHDTSFTCSVRVAQIRGMQSDANVDEHELASHNFELSMVVSRARWCEWMNREFPTQHFVGECALLNLMFLLFILQIL